VARYSCVSIDNLLSGRKTTHTQTPRIISYRSLTYTASLVCFDYLRDIRRSSVLAILTFTERAMSVRIQLDDPHSFYTNLDFISGRVILSLANDDSISAINVKLEGESRTVSLLSYTHVLCYWNTFLIPSRNSRMQC
jgi:hypothetical protein